MGGRAAKRTPTFCYHNQMSARTTAPWRLTSIWGAFWLGLSVFGCGASQEGPLPTGPSPIVATVRIEHFGVPEAFSGLEENEHAEACMSTVGRTYLRASWRSNHSYVMTPDEGDPHHWVIEFDDVPVGKRVMVQIHDPLACGESPSGEVTGLRILVNGLPLAHRVDASTGRGYSFTVAVGGSVRG